MILPPFFKHLFVFSSFLALGGYLLSIDTDWVYIYITYIVVVIYVIINSKGRVSHPAVLFSIIFSLYVIAYPLVVDFGLLPDKGLSSKVVYYHMLGYIGFSVTIILLCNNDIYTEPHVYKTTRMSRVIAQTALIMFFVLSMIAILYILNAYINGFHKGSGGGNLFYRSAFIFNWLIFMASFSILYCFGYGNNPSLGRLVLILTLIILLIDMLVTGHRSTVGYAILAMIVLYDLVIKRISFISFAILFVILFLVFGLVKQYLTGVSAVSFISFFYQEFKTSGRILAASIELFDGRHDLLFYIHDVVSSFTPSILGLRDNFQHDLHAYIVGHDTDVGLGFSMIAEGFIPFGVFGIFINMFMLGGILAYLHRKAQGSMLWKAVYICSLIVVCSKIRHGVWAAVAVICKSILLPIILLFVIRSIVITRRRERYCTWQKDLASGVSGEVQRHRF